MPEIFTDITSALENLNTKRLENKTGEFLSKHNLTVSIINRPNIPCLIVANHPTIWDSIFWRAAGHIYHAVNAEASAKTGIPFIDIPLTRMIPVYKGEKRKETYQLIADSISSGKQVVLNPTGMTSGTNEIPSPEEIKIGGTYRSLQLSNDKILVPALVEVNGEILPNGTVEDGSKIRIKFSAHPLDLSNIDFNRDLAPLKLSQQICDEWTSLKSI